MKKRSWSVGCLLCCLGFTCGGDDRRDVTNDAIVINDTEDAIELVVRRPTVPCVEISSYDMQDLTQSDFGAPQTVTYPGRSVSVLPAQDDIDCYAEIFWLQLGEFSGIVSWSGPHQGVIPKYVSDVSPSRVLFVDNRNGTLELIVGNDIESFPAPPEGPPALTSDRLYY